jgi:hypothetical protein
MTNAAYSSVDFYREDFLRTLFPLVTNRVLVERGSADLLSFAHETLTGKRSFLPQRRVYANKDALHLRRTIKLDAVAEFFFYDLIFRNRILFRKPYTDARQHFGYRFEEGRPLPPSKSYGDFKLAAWRHMHAIKENISFDIASYFNSTYHHDLHAWFTATGAPSGEADAFGKFLREINAGRSLDCLPQGLYPAKMVGSDFLRFIENSSTIRASKTLRFMDDFCLFDNDIDVLKADFAEVQRLLGLKGLSVNSSKTKLGDTPSADQEDRNISELKKTLLKRRRRIIVSHYDGDEEVEDDAVEVTEEEIQYILSLLGAGQPSEEDAELILIVMREHVDRIEGHLSVLAKGFPHLAKNFFALCADARDKEAVADIVLGVVKEGEHIGEYQLFWFGMMLDNYLINTKRAPEIVDALYKHSSATDISRAKVLEIADRRYGLPEMRESFLRDGRSDWLAWASAAGSLAMDKSARNYLLGYFANGSEMNKLIANIIQKG